MLFKSSGNVASRAQTVVGIERTQENVLKVSFIAFTRP